MKLLFLRKFSQKDQEYITNSLSKYYDILIPDDFSEKKIISKAINADVFLGIKITENILNAAENLKLIQVPGSGIDLLALELMKFRNIVICNSHSNSTFVGEHAVALLFSLIKKIALHDRKLREGNWYRPKNTEYDGLYMSDTIINKTVGFLGFGHVGQYIAKYLSGFDCSYIAHVKNESKPRLIYPGSIDFVSLFSLFKLSDMLFITLPLTKATKGMVSLKELSMMKNKAYLINVSRADIIEQEDLYNCLADCCIAGAGLDVWYDDICNLQGRTFPSSNFPFHILENALLSPYRAGYVQQDSPHLIGAVNNLISYATTGELKNIVNLEAEY